MAFVLRPLKMVSVILLIICVPVCVVSSAVQTSPVEPEPNKKFDEVQAAVFSRKAYPEPGDIPVLNRKVFRGARVQVEEHPYVVSVRRFHGHYLTGAILGAHTVVTVANPIYNVLPTELGVVAGETYCDRGASYMTVLLVVTHQDFDPYTLKADLALLRLYDILFLKNTQKPIRIFQKFKDTHPKARSVGQMEKQSAQKAFVTGWGRCDWMGNELCLPRSSVYFPDEKQDPMLRTISFNHSYLNESIYCVGYEKHMIRLQSGNGMLCVGEAREAEALAPCMAVPGAPLTVLAQLVGLQSWGFGCGYTHDLPLIYTDLRYYANWTKSNLQILEALNTDYVSDLYSATKAFFMEQWLEQTSDQRVRHRAMPLQPADIDTQLVGLLGNTTDFRDYIYGGVFKEQKAEMYRVLKAESEEKRRVKEISDDIYLEVHPFLNQKYFNLITDSETTTENVTNESTEG